MERYLNKFIENDLSKKIVLLSGPRQVGKTTLALGLRQNSAYLNFDVPEQRKVLIERSWRRDVDLVIFDELHKLRGWKGWLKGIYDGEGLNPAIMVTGSARLDIAKKMGDSLAGRHFLYHLHPLDLKELAPLTDTKSALNRLMTVGGFPEPYFSADPHFSERWRRSHLDIILRQDLLDLEQITRISQLETLVELLRERVGSPISAQSLSEDLGINDTTVRRWLRILENLYVVFRVVPWHRNIARSLKKSPKYYFFDTGLVRGDQGAMFENLVACALLKEVHFRRDTEGREIELRYLRTRDGDEIDFAVVEKNRPKHFIEVKWSDDEIPKAFSKGDFRVQREKLQITSTLVVGTGGQERDHPDGVCVRRAQSWLATLDFSSN